MAKVKDVVGVKLSHLCKPSLATIRAYFVRVLTTTGHWHFSELSQVLFHVHWPISLSCRDREIGVGGPPGKKLMRICRGRRELLKSVNLFV